MENKSKNLLSFRQNSSLTVIEQERCVDSCGSCNPGNRKHSLKQTNKQKSYFLITCVSDISPSLVLVPIFSGTVICRSDASESTVRKTCVSIPRI